VILIGDIAIPQVNDQGTSYPSIYPYVDFVDPLFVYNESSKTFDRNIVPITIPQPEIWHGIMPFGNDSSSYHRFFAKLKKYVADPSTYVARKMWYDDIIQMKQTFLHEQVPYYSNNFLFTEDIGNNRLTNLMLDVMRESHNDIVENALDALQEAVVPSVND